jgi:hypothetical protein
LLRCHDPAGPGNAARSVSERLRRHTDSMPREAPTTSSRAKAP